MKYLVFVAFLFIATITNAQTDGAPPTKDDAVNFINKVLLNNYWLLKDNSYPVKSIVVSIQDCHLIIKEAKPFTGTPDFVTTTIIDLTQCTVAKTIAERTDIATCDSMSIITNIGDNGITVTKTYNHKTGTPENLSYFKFVLLANYVVKTNNYQARLEKALEFLINSCNGSGIKKDNNDKF
jgi:hypothetical protein